MIFSLLSGLGFNTLQPKVPATKITVKKRLFNKLEKLLPNLNIKFAYGHLPSDKTRKKLQVYALKTSPIYENANDDWAKTVADGEEHYIKIYQQIVGGF